MLGVESDMASVFMEFIDYVGVLLLGDKIKWNVLIHPRRQNISEEPWEDEKRCREKAPTKGNIIPWPYLEY